ncbi:MAG TPA: right-handed parallel beta-helix repeat-containing protein [Rhodocyclaceae bacterium]|nr:right-handed parallel beta-helix repeat-containing protein [Rhodocyclaceae bacterium]
MKKCLAGISLLVFALSAHATTWRVDPHGPLKTIAAASAKAVSGDVVEIVAGDYHGDVTTWTQSNLTIRAVGGRARLYADGRSAEGKAIWVIRAGNITIENIEFLEARVPDRNGAGIRLEAGNLTIRNCRFIDNEDGILTADNEHVTLRIENSEFDGNGDGSGQTHNLYVGKIARLTVVGSYFHRANVGHLLKSRAILNVITYNRLTDEAGGRASYELEFPNGGIALVVGNLIEQSSTTDNSNIISVGAEGLSNPNNVLYLSYNSIFDDRVPAGRYVDVRGTEQVFAYNNVLSGGGSWSLPADSIEGGNVEAKWSDFAMPMRQDYRPEKNAKWLNKVVAIPSDTLDPVLRAEGLSLVPREEYVHPMSHVPLKKAPAHPGAVQDVMP